MSDINTSHKNCKYVVNFSSFLILYLKVSTHSCLNKPHVRPCLLHLRPCSHCAYFCLFCKKICQQEAISSARDFFHLPKFSQLTPPNLKDVGLKFFSSNKILCSLTAIPQSSDNLILQTWQIFYYSSFNWHFCLY